MSWIYAELVAVSLAAMLSPTTLTFSVLALVLGDRPFRTGLFFYIGALTATLAVGVAAAFVLGDVAASETPSQPKTWVAILDVVAACSCSCGRRGSGATRRVLRSRKGRSIRWARSPRHLRLRSWEPARCSPTPVPSYRSR